MRVEERGGWGCVTALSTPRLSPLVTLLRRVRIMFAMRLPTRRVVSSLPVILAIIALLLSALYVIGLVFDWPAWLRGSNWVWVRRVPSPGARFWLMPAALAGGVALGAAARRARVWAPRGDAGFLRAVVGPPPPRPLSQAPHATAHPLTPSPRHRATIKQPRSPSHDSQKDT